MLDDEQDIDIRLNTKELARRLRMQPNTLEKWRNKGIGPLFIKQGKSVFYKKTDVEAWEDSQKMSSTSSVPS